MLLEKWRSLSNANLLVIAVALFAMYIVLLIYIVYTIKTLKRMESRLREYE
jgi:uncharacterized protein YoxC